MALKKVKLGDLLELTLETNQDLKFGPLDVRGMTISKKIISTKANVDNADLRKFLIIKPNDFIFNPRTHGKKIGFGFNDTNSAFIISWNNVGFRIKQNALAQILPEYLFMHFNREEWDREACFRSWGSSTEVFSWEALCEMTIFLPPIDVQKKYVDIYLAMLANQRAYEQGLDDLKLVCDAYIEDLRRKMPSEEIGPYIQQVSEKNVLGTVTDNKAVSVEKVFVSSHAELEGVNIKNYLIVKNMGFAYNTVTTRNADKISIAINHESTCLVSPIYTVFKTNSEKLLPEYLMLWFKRTEFDRYSRYNSWGSAREMFTYDDMKKVKIPVPNILIQKSIAEIYSVFGKNTSISLFIDNCRLENVFSNKNNIKQHSIECILRICKKKHVFYSENFFPNYLHLPTIAKQGLEKCGKYNAGYYPREKEYISKELIPPNLFPYKIRHCYAYRRQEKETEREVF